MHASRLTFVSDAGARWWTRIECRQVLRGAEERARAGDADEHATTQALERLEDIDEVRALSTCNTIIMERPVHAMKATSQWQWRRAITNNVVCVYSNDKDALRSSY